MAKTLRQYGQTTLGVWPPPIVEAIYNREAFQAGNLWAESTDYWPIGELPDRWIARIVNDSPSYIVFSYRTPIAWWSELNGWVVPDVRYSVTTSRHQGFVRRAVT